MVFDAFIPRSVRALLCSAPLSATPILSGGAVLQLQADCYSKAESDGKYLTQSGRGRGVRRDHRRGRGGRPGRSLTASSHVRTPRVDTAGNWLEVRGGTAGTHMEDSSGNVWATLTSAQAFFATPLLRTAA